MTGWGRLAQRQSGRRCIGEETCTKQLGEAITKAQNFLMASLADYVISLVFPSRLFTPQVIPRGGIGAPKHVDLDFRRQNLWPTRALFTTPETPDHQVLSQLFIAINVLWTVVVILVRPCPIMICKYRPVIASACGWAKGVM